MQESEPHVIRNYASGSGKLTPDNEPDLLFLNKGKLLALCEVKTPCMIKREVFNGQLKRFAERCEKATAVFYLCVPSQSLGAALTLISETRVFEKLAKKKKFRLFTFNANSDGFTAELEEVQL